MRKIYLSAGHNVVCGHTSGAKTEYGNESLLTIEMKEKVAERLRKKGVEFITDRDDMTLGQVVEEINGKIGKEGYAIELHFNASTIKSVRGTEVVVYNRSKLPQTARAKELSDIVSGILGTNNRGVKGESQSAHGRLAFVRKTKCEAVILEICFLSNKEDMESYNANKEKLADAIADYLEKL